MISTENNIEFLFRMGEGGLRNIRSGMLCQTHDRHIYIFHELLPQNSFMSVHFIYDYFISHV